MELNHSIILDQEKHLCVRELRVQAVPFCARCHLIPCTADTYRKPAAPTPLSHFFAKGKTNTSEQSKSKWEK